jgi:hypothetical protein
MQVGDLVKRNGVNASKELGIIVQVEEDDSMYVPHVFVSWGGKNPIVWNPCHSLEVVNVASR